MGQEIFKVHSDVGLEFIKECLESIDEYDDYNKMGHSIRMLINGRGTEVLKQVIKYKDGV